MAGSTDALDDAGFDWGSELTDDTVTAKDGALAGSRGGTGTARTTTGTRRRRSVGEKRLTTLQEKLSDEMFTAGAMIGLGLPVTGLYTCQESDNFTKALVQLASKNTRWIEALENLAMIQPGLIVGRTAVGFGAAFAVDRGRADPEKQFMKFLGVTSAWESLQNPDGKGNAREYVPPPSKFTPVA